MKKQTGKTNKKYAYKPKHLRKVKTRKNKSKSNLKGGSAFLNSTYTGFPIRYVIPINKYETDVQGQQISSRLDPQVSTTTHIKGGSKKRKLRKTVKKMKGGFIPFSFIKSMSDPIAGVPNNLIMTTGSGSGGMIAHNLMTNNAGNNKSPIPINIKETHLV